ncbi:MAG: hypothetical protein A3G08_00415 [Candidatus Magasanikbacteria bacterium RIFCSPLOWO2_12_FULL_47_9b]|nr:MAG: hypothetical protein A3I74_04270 [Candidatus Magasanikbacteria bacterium RIFCSPLOWO2_02_FULL_47_16]OGH79373.1 MAG: hypothetical protein A3C10_04805 [Candidatus Magasanikbacteria bacterium RIFCSPHIGHO2_02_FULL_48_18]OGH83525.1 MAG: hypothetical protein A3G08_00415 [Candidatus Magasanikbacteria bacterium RIFCSPLOWO2_12_FULL_47_9b]
MPRPVVSLIIPVFNEEHAIENLYDRIIQVVASVTLAPLEHIAPEFIFVDDGSTDRSPEILSRLATRDPNVRVITFTRNFGKEMATTAGIIAASGDACLVMDADFEHPPEYIPSFLDHWRSGAKIVVGVRENKNERPFFTRFSSWIFYSLMARIADRSGEFVPNATDFRLLDRAVVLEFKKFTEHDRMTRGLIDWLGFPTVYVPFINPGRKIGKATYAGKKRWSLAMDTFAAYSLFPLKIAGYLGMGITVFSGLLGIFIFATQYLFHRWSLDFTGTAQLAVLNMFLIGIVLSCLGFIALYIGQIHHEVANRPLYVIKQKINFETEKEEY